jgi:hypothetical protein
MKMTTMITMMIIDYFAAGRNTKACKVWHKRTLHVFEFLLTLDSRGEVVFRHSPNDV